MQWPLQCMLRGMSWYYVARGMTWTRFATAMVMCERHGMDEICDSDGDPQEAWHGENSKR